MKSNNYTLITWNVHKMRISANVPEFVIQRISRDHTDIICITEYKYDSGIIHDLEKNYWWAESEVINGQNGIFLAVRKDIVLSEPEVIRNTCEYDKYNFFHIRVVNKESKVINIIGVRFLSPMNASEQTPPLLEYLQQIQESYICTGDFNIKGSRMNKWFPGIKMEKRLKGDNFLNDYSIVYTKRRTFVINGYGDVDHVLLSHDFSAMAEYDWDFLKEDEAYPEFSEVKTGNKWKIPVCYPDHAILKANISSMW